MTRERTWWQRWVYDAEEARERREERVFTNSAWWGLCGLVLAVGFASMRLATGTLDVVAFFLAAVIAYRGGLRVWRGIRRWRAGGEFNLPGSPGPILRSPPPHQRGE